jgi:hypothetical protein
MTVGAYDNCYTSGHCCPTDAGNKGVKLAETDTQGIGLASNTDVMAPSMESWGLPREGQSGRMNAAMDT